MTEQYIRITPMVRQSWLHSIIYIFSTNEMGHCNIEQIDRMLTVSISLLLFKNILKLNQNRN